MIVTLAGDNYFAISEELKSMVSNFISSNSELGVERLDGEEAEFSKIREALTSLPFLSDKKLVIIYKASKNKEFNEAFKDLEKQVPEQTTLVIVEPNLDKRLSIHKLLKSRSDFKEFKQLSSSELIKWLVARAKSKDSELSLSDAQYLVERVGSNQQLLSSEVDKLILYNHRISQDGINLLTEQAPAGTIFQLLEAAFNNQPKNLLRLYKEQREQKVDPAQIIAMLAWQLHLLAIIKMSGGKKPNVIASEAKLNPYVVMKSQTIAKRLSLTELKGMTEDLLNVDIASKSRGIDTDEALQHYLLNIALI